MLWFYLDKGKACSVKFPPLGKTERFRDPLRAEVVELVDALVSETSESNLVGVRLPPSAPFENKCLKRWAGYSMSPAFLFGVVTFGMPLCGKLYPFCEKIFHF